MILKTAIYKRHINKVCIGDVHELHVTSRSNTSRVYKYKIKILGVVKDKVRCQGCFIQMNEEEVFKHKHKAYCEDCYTRRKR